MERKISPVERIFARSPYAIVTMVARIKGNVSENMLRDAVKKVQTRHENLRVRILEDKDHVQFFTSNKVEEIPIEVISRESDDHWIRVSNQAYMIPFEFELRPAIRFILLQSSTASELIILCHHIICDGLSLAYLARDILIHLGNPNREVELLPEVVPVDKDNLPKEASINSVIKYFLNRINKKWRKNPTYFDQEDYLSLNLAYWKNFKHQIVSVELSKAETTGLVDRCRNEKITVNTAITSAFVAAQSIIQGKKANPNIAIATSVRNHLSKPAGEAMGYFAGGVSLEYKYNQKMTFWDNSRKLHQKLKKLYKTKNLIKELATWSNLDPGIMEAIPYKIIGGLVSPDSPRYDKLSGFSKQDDVISSILKTQKMESLEKPFLGTAVTNLTRMNFPQKYGELELDRLIMNPGGMFPLATVNLVVGVVTCSGKLSLLLEYEEKTFDTTTIKKIKENALKFLLE